MNLKSKGKQFLQYSCEFCCFATNVPNCIPWHKMSKSQIQAFLKVEKHEQKSTFWILLKDMKQALHE
jgi:hypothetical protein